VTGSWKSYLLGTSKLLRKFNLTIFKMNLFTHLDKPAINPSCCEVSHQKLLLVEDMNDYISPINVPKG